jgi:tripartite-type tricarboxylate transporter receptor subunit TctC
MPIPRTIIRIATTVLAVFAAAPAAYAQPYPAKPVRLVIPFAPGGTTDIVGRLVGDRLGRELGQPVIIENRAGGGGTVGADYVAKSPPDGYVISMATVSTMATNPAMNPKMPYDATRDFVAVINLVNVPNVMTVNPARLPAGGMKEFIAMLKAGPGRYSYGSGGTGSISHLDVELFKVLTGTYMVHIPYRGSGPAMNDTIAGQVDAQIDNLPSSLPHIKAGKLKALAVMAEKRVDGLPEVPTFAEVGLKDANNMAWYGLLAPTGTPKDVSDKLRAAALRTLADPDTRKRLTDSGALIDGGTGEQFAQKIAREQALRRDIVKKQKLTLD